MFDHSRVAYFLNASSDLSAALALALSIDHTMLHTTVLSTGEKREERDENIIIFELAVVS